jgi:prophage regulatory protein
MDLQSRGGIKGGKHAPHKPQPVAAAECDNALLQFATVSALAGIGRSTIYQKVAEGTFPQPIKLGLRCTRFRAGDITAWLKAQVPGA